MMWRLTLLTLLVALAGCGRNTGMAQAGLAQVGLPFSERAFVESAREGNVAAVKLFLDAGMTPDAKNGEGQTPLMAATLFNQIETVEALLAGGADVDAKNKARGTALLTAAW